MQFEDLLNGKEIHTTLDEQIVFSQLKNSAGAIWSMLLASGYLKVTDHRTDERTGREFYSLALTNREVHLMFENVIHDWFAEVTEDTVKTALSQIEEKQYTVSLAAKGISPDRIRTYGFAFEGKKVLIGGGDHEIL